MSQPGTRIGSLQPAQNAGATGATGAGVTTAAVTITTGQMLALRASPKTLVAAPGAGKVLELVGIVLILDFATTGYTEVAANLAVKYLDGSGIQASDTIEATGFVDATADTAIAGRPKNDVLLTKAQCENQALVLHNLGAAEYLLGDSPVRAKVTYRTHDTDW